MKGPRSVCNDITLTADSNPIDLKTGPENSLRRSGETGSKFVTVETSCGNATLRGYVDLWAGGEGPFPRHVPLPAS